MSLKRAMAAIALSAAASAANAENCAQFPPGPARFDCASRNHPGLQAKRERCQQEGHQMGLKPGGGLGGGGGGGLKEYVMATCSEDSRSG
jgi:hypothetical protein